MWLDLGSDPGPLALEADALPTALRDEAKMNNTQINWVKQK